jgi:hypothetical protein
VSLTDLSPLILKNKSDIMHRIKRMKEIVQNLNAFPQE